MRVIHIADELKGCAYDLSHGVEMGTEPTTIIDAAIKKLFNTRKLITNKPDYASVDNYARTD